MSEKIVSVVVVTYNFQEVILETLESIRRQTYKYLELIISDDCSSDKTIEIAKKWIEKNRERFKNIKVVEHNKNTGPTANYNRGLKAATGEWIKYISDDIMEENFIEDAVNIVTKNPNIKIIFSKLIGFTGEFKEKKFKEVFPEEKDLYIYEMEPEKQLEELHKKCYIAAPTNFIKRSLLEDVGYCDENYEFFEDYPLWIKILENGEKIYLNNKINIYYRRWEKSVSSNGDKYLNVKQHEFMKKYFHNEQKFKMKDKIARFEKNINLKREEIIINSGNIGETIYSKILRYTLISRYKKKKYKIIIGILVLIIIYLILK